MITAIIYVIIYFVIEFFKAYYFYNNQDFDKIFSVVYVFIIIPYFVAVIFLFVYLIASDGRDTRAYIPWCILTASIVSFILVAWVIIYFCFIY